MSPETLCAVITVRLHSCFHRGDPPSPEAREGDGEDNVAQAATPGENSSQPQNEALTGKDTAGAAESEEEKFGNEGKPKAEEVEDDDDGDDYFVSGKETVDQISSDKQPACQTITPSTMSLCRRGIRAHCRPLCRGCCECGLCSCVP